MLVTQATRTGEVLMADANYRPIAIRPIDDGMPDNFTLITTVVMNLLAHWKKQSMGCSTIFDERYGRRC